MRAADDDKTDLQRLFSQGLAPRPVAEPSAEPLADWAVLVALGGGPKEPRFPEVGERFADCLLLAELGRGTEGRVFLASHPTI